MVSRMPRRARTKSMSGIYHIMLRGVNRQEIFHDDEDCLVFLGILRRYKVKSEINVYSWCLMNNHIHLLLKEGNESISATMKRIAVSFVLYYNEKYGTSGHLFQDRFKSENIESRKSYLTVLRYIHQNPVKAGLTKTVVEWRWSSCRFYYDAREGEGQLLDSAFTLDLFSEDYSMARERFKEFNDSDNQDQCLDDHIKARRLTDADAREKIKEQLKGIEIAQIKSLPRLERNKILREIKEINGISQRQAARILGISKTLICKS